MNIPPPPVVSGSAKPSSSKKKAPTIPTAAPVAAPVAAPTADMVSMSRADFEAMIASAVTKAVAGLDPKALKAQKKEQAKLDRKAANKARGDEALERCMDGGRNSEEKVKAVFREAYTAAKGLSGEAYKAAYNEVCIAKLGVPRYVATAA